MLLEDLGKSLSWHVDEFQSYQALRDHVIERTEERLFVQGKVSRVYAAGVI